MSTVKALNTKSVKSALNEMEIESRIQSLKDELKSLGASFAETGSDEAKRLIEQGEGLAHTAVAKSREAIDAMSSELATLEARTSARIRDKPLQSLGLAIGAGIILSLLMRK